MASNIDVTKPVTGSATTESVRQNFTAAKAEIEALQALTDNGAMAENAQKAAFTQISGVTVISTFDIAHLAGNTTTEACVVQLPDPAGMTPIDSEDATKVSVFKYILHNYTDGNYPMEITVANTQFNNGLSQLSLFPGQAVELWVYNDHDGQTGAIINYLRGVFIYQVTGLGPYTSGSQSPLNLTGGTTKNTIPDLVSLDGTTNLIIAAQTSINIKAHAEVEWTGSNSSSNFVVLMLAVKVNGIEAISSSNTLVRRTGAIVPLDIDISGLEVAVNDVLTLEVTSPDEQDFVVTDVRFNIKGE